MLQDWRRFPFGWDTGKLSFFMVNIITMLEFLRKIRCEQPSLPAGTWSFQKLDFLKVFFPAWSLCCWQWPPCYPKYHLKLEWAICKTIPVFQCHSNDCYCCTESQSDQIKLNSPQGCNCFVFLCLDQPLRGKLRIIQCCNRCTFTLQPKLL